MGLFSHKIFLGYSLSTYMQAILKQKFLLWAGQQEATPVGLFCMDSNAECFIEFYAHHHSISPGMLQPFQLTSNQFFSVPDYTLKELGFLNFRTMPFFIPLSAWKFYRATGAQSLF